MEDLLREFLELALEEMRNARVPNQLRSSNRSSKPKKSDSSDADESDADDKKVEMSTVATALVPGGGYTGHLGASSADMQPGNHPVAGERVKNHKNKHVRIK